MRTKWNKVSGTFVVSIYRHPVLDWYIDDSSDNEMFSGLIHGTQLPQFLDKLEDPSSLVIEFESTGYNDTGSMYGGSDRMGWAPEGDDERTPVRAYIDDPKNLLLNDLMNELFEVFIDEIYKVELDYPN